MASKTTSNVHVLKLRNFGGGGAPLTPYIIVKPWSPCLYTFLTLSFNRTCGWWVWGSDRFGILSSATRQTPIEQRKWAVEEQSSTPEEWICSGKRETQQRKVQCTCTCTFAMLCECSVLHWLCLQEYSYMYMYMHIHCTSLACQTLLPKGGEMVWWKLCKQVLAPIFGCTSVTST